LPFVAKAKSPDFSAPHFAFFLHFFKKIETITLKNAKKDEKTNHSLFICT
jgi:hypothetical protein